MKFGIVVATFRAEATLRRCLESVAFQTTHDWKLVVMDGGSDDGTVAILDEWSDRISHWHSAPDKGVYDAWNKALPFVSDCEWVYFLGADDMLASADVLERASRGLADVPRTIPLAYGQVIATNAEDQALETRGEPWETARRLLAVQTPIPHTATFHRYYAFRTLGAFDCAFRIAGDYDFILRACKLAPPHFLQGLTVSRMQLGGMSSARSQELSTLHEFVAARRKNGVRPAVGLGFAWAYLKAAVKLLLFKALGRAGSERLVDAYRRFTGRPAIHRRHP